MTADPRVVFESENRRRCTDRALVLDAVGIPYQVLEDNGVWVLLVAANESARASRELGAYDDENPPANLAPPPRPTEYDAIPGLVGYVLTICVIAGMAGFQFFDANWPVAGRIDGERIRDGEIWRLVTALTLHSGIRHLLGNIVFGVFFGLFAGRLLGYGVAWLAILVAAIAGNLANTLLLDPRHLSIGASTAVFAALGLVSGYVWRGRLLRAQGWTGRYGPIIGGLALLMYTGTGGERTDVGAHLMGFIGGFSAGVLLIRYSRHWSNPILQRRAAQTALGLIVISWGFALAV